MSENATHAKLTIQALEDCISKVKMNSVYRYDQEKLLDEKIGWLANNCQNVLDFGKSSRSRYELFKEGQITTTDITEYEGYPDIIDDICDIQNLEFGVYDGIICVAILEHVYAPHIAVDNLRKLVKEGGHVLVYVPFLYNYHGGKKYFDFFRFTKDGLGYLFKDFSEVELFPVRGKFSTMFNHLGFWKYRVESLFNGKINKLLDKMLNFYGDEQNNIQASGYYIWAKK